MSSKKQKKTKKNKRRNREILKHKSVYIFCYGSIVNIKSLEKTIGKVPEKPIPAIINKSAGYKRIWSCMKSEFGTFSYLNVIQDKNPDPINGTLVHLKSAQLLKLLNNREVHYQIKPIARKHFTFLNKEIPINARIYIFSDNSNKGNKNDCYIMQSYLDVVTDGFLNYGKKFKKDFEKYTMRNISKNDILQNRKFPLYYKNRRTHKKRK